MVWRFCNERECSACIERGRKAERTKMAKKKALKLSDYARAQYGERSSMCSDGRKCYDWLLKMEKKGYSINRIIKLAKRVSGGDWLGYLDIQTDDPQASAISWVKGFERQTQLSPAFRNAVKRELKRLTSKKERGVVVRKDEDGCIYPYYA